ncbi:NineTeen Complex (NTC) component [Alternaria novae-zelandiae]|uniref:NineTeen Complex (NTC) component n=1 Tax=Alternaria metachromatica TaxID=283354 RepID=UPI0020C445EE|nr:NineTeen Complex (NTC) component [Alternaria metachromatica]XP_049203790.1 NineTeen Complex (NTC) component [Alternaria ventricosa]XP_049215785.1 NineTeen Complex (NTC) component [Alternaria viburni]XP_049220074.1 NineTeen Complex (NTC) component [Alternaria triticimaculans]XP_049229574.1 NineTeen Complex (NTC) component [Alternaria ethzedia]XP_049253051.1 NineTeen Complex (NTC) component [Alternaria novae-zelandiae]XP_051287312.1 NineTeen Complex (NTC) component [Alternaria incomplexa]XP
MARNSEKAHSMLFRFRAAQAAEAGIIDISRTRRPKLITSVNSIPVCEKWRGQVLKEISRKVTKIQDEALSDYQIRDLNDEINKLMREKHMWESQIRGLGGPNYMRGGRVLDEEGREVPGGGKGYRYFGRAKDLPGVKELFERQSRPEDDMDKGREKRSELRQKVDAGYYGYNLDEEDGTLLAYETAKEQEAWDNFMLLGDELDAKPSKTQKEWMELPGDVGDGIRWRIPTLDEVNNELVERRRRKLLEKLG